MFTKTELWLDQGKRVIELCGYPEQIMIKDTSTAKTVGYPWNMSGETIAENICKEFGVSAPSRLLYLVVGIYDMTRVH